MSSDAGPVSVSEPEELGGKWNSMNLINLQPSNKILPRPAFRKTKRPNDLAWKPQPCGLSREELRRLVADILG